MANLNEQDSDGLTEEERAALAEGDDAGTDTYAKGEGDDTATRDDGDAVDAAAEAKAAEEAAAKAEADAAAEKAAEEAKAAAKPAEAAATTEQVNTALTEAQAAAAEKQKEFDEAKAAYDLKMQELADAKAKLDTDVDDGEITMAEFRKKMDELSKQERDAERVLDKQERDLELVKFKATDIEDRERNAAKIEWDKQCGEFLDANPVYRDDPDKMQTLNSYVITIAKSEPKLTGPQILAKAHSIVSGEPLVKPEPAKDGKKPPVTTKKPELPPNLSKMPASEGTDTDGDGRWAALDRLQTTDYNAYEKKLGEMSETDRDAYLRA